MADVKVINTKFSTEVDKVDTVAESNIARINTIDWNPIYAPSPYNGVGSGDSVILTNGGRFSGSGGAGQSTTTGVYSGWVKTATRHSNWESISGLFGWASDNNNWMAGYLQSDIFNLYSIVSNSYTFRRATDAINQDGSHWYHVYMRWNTSEATAQDRAQIWINGVDMNTVGWQVNTTHGTQGRAALGTGWSRYFGWCWIGASYYSEYKLAEAHMFDGTTPAVTEFGEFTDDGLWIPKTYAGSEAYGTYGYYLDFDDENDLGNDVSGNNNDRTPTSLTSANHSIDHPETNYATGMWAASYYTGFSMFWGLNANNGAANYRTMGTNWGPLKKGKWYWESHSGGLPSICNIGITSAEQANFVTSTAKEMGGSVYDFVGTMANDTVFRGRNNGTFKTGNFESGSNQNTYHMYAFDADNNKFWIGRNGTWFQPSGGSEGDPAAGTDPTYDSSDGIDAEKYDYFIAMSAYTSQSVILEFGDRLGFSGTVPSGFRACNGEEWADVFGTTTHPTEVINTTDYDGDGSTDHAITGVGFQPDLVVVKSSNNRDWVWVDSVRGVTQELNCNNNNSEDVVTVNVKSFDSDGFTVGNGSRTNENGEYYLAFCLKQLSGFFDIQIYNGTGVAHAENHDLGVVPEFMIVKRRNANNTWQMYHHHAVDRDAPEEYSAELDVSSTWRAQSTIWNDTAPTASQFTVGTANQVNNSSGTYVAYLFASKDGICKVGSSYTETDATADAGGFYHCGFRPEALIIMSETSSGSNDYRLLTARAYHGAVNQSIGAPEDASNTRQWRMDTQDQSLAATGGIQLMGNGFKIHKTSNAWLNDDLYWIAFAHQPWPFVNPRAV